MYHVGHDAGLTTEVAIRPCGHADDDRRLSGLLAPSAGPDIYHRAPGIDWDAGRGLERGSES